MSLPCPTRSCTRTMPGHLQVCGACASGTLRDLADVPSLDRHLELAAARQTRIGGGGGTARRDQGEEIDLDLALTLRHGPLPWDERARTAQHHLRTVLVGWVRVLQDGVKPYRGPVCMACAHPSCTYLDLGHGPAADTMAAVAEWLIRHRAQLLGRSWAPEVVDGIAEAIHRARKAIDRPADRIYAGPCNICGADLLARPGHSSVVCRACSLVYDVPTRQEWMRAEVEHLLGNATWVAAVATSLGYKVSASTVRTWGMRGGIAQRGTEPSLKAGADPHPLYRVGDVIERIAKRRPAS